MMHEHGMHAGAGAPTVLAVMGARLAAAGYVLLARRERRGARGWSVWRSASFVAGTVLLAAAAVPALVPYPEGSFAAHMHEHLLIGMYAPLGIVLGAPVTRLLRSLPHAPPAPVPAAPEGAEPGREVVSGAVVITPPPRRSSRTGARARRSAARSPGPR